MLNRVGVRTAAWLGERTPWTNAYGLARTVLALGVLGTFIANDAGILFHPLNGVPVTPVCESASTVSYFCAFGGHLELARWIAMAILLLVASGWRPRVTGVLHWWVAWSWAASGSPIDGGDQISAILALILVPVTLLDSRRWHWDAPRPTQQETRPIARLVAFSALLVARVQVAGIYFHAAVGKVGVPEWDDGTAVYYVATDPFVGQGAWLIPLFEHGFVVAAATWGTIVFEAVLFAGLFMDRRYRRPLLLAGLAFHAMIIVLFGLFSFFFSMSAALLLLLHPADEPWPWLTRAWARVQACRPAQALSATTVRASAALAVLLGSGCYTGPEPLGDHPRCGAIGRVAQRIVEETEAPGVAVAVIGPQGWCSASAGVADPHDGTPLHPDDVFRVGSITKTTVAMAVDKLVSEGRIDLDASASVYAPDLGIDEAITVRHLLDHRSGLPDYVTTASFYPTSFTSPGRVWTPEELVDLALTEEGLDPQAPGASFRYSSTGYVILGTIIERVTGQSVEQVVQERVFEPRGLESASLATAISRPSVIAGWEAVSEGNRLDDVSGLFHPSATWTAGGMVSSAPDLALLHHSISPEFRADAIDEAGPTESERYPSYAHGLTSRDWALGRCWGHDGRMPGYAGIVMHCADADTTIAVLMNRNSQELELAFDAILSAALD